MKTKTGEVKTGRQDIADIFAAFYEELYASTVQVEPLVGCCGAGAGDPIPLFTPEEVSDAIKRLRSNRCPDQCGVVAEMLKAGSGVLVDVLCSLYNQIVQPDAPPPESWKRSMVTVIYKSGDKQLPQQYRPITIIPLLYKVFARLLYQRLSAFLLPAQPPAQAGFRPNYSTDDHLFTFAQIFEKSNEWKVPVWIATIDFQKAFDTVEHQSLWNALHKQKVPDAYVRILAKLYTGQEAQVRTDKTSRIFSLERGTKQGDPLSSLLFNAILEDIFGDVSQLWESRRYGIHLSGAPCDDLTNLRFADDVLLFARTLPQLQQMVAKFQCAARARGLLMHPDKTKILTNATRHTGRATSKFADIEGMRLEILDFADTTKYLGRLIGFDHPHNAEIDNRIRVAWKRFMANKQELTSKSYTLRNRLRLFDSVVTSSMLYGSASWTLTQDLQSKLQRTQRKMLRMILGSGRRKLIDSPEIGSDHASNSSSGASDSGTSGTSNHLEAWQDWLKRTAHTAESQLQKYKIDNWITAWRRKVWRWAGRVARFSRERWALKASQWDPASSKHAKGRPQAHPRKRWSDDIVCFLKSKDITTTSTEWHRHAMDRSQWTDWEEEFCRSIEKP